MDESDPLAIDWLFYGAVALNVVWTFVNLWGFRQSRRLLHLAAVYYEDARLTYERAFDIAKDHESKK